MRDIYDINAAILLAVGIVIIGVSTFIATTALPQYAYFAWHWLWLAAIPIIGVGTARFRDIADEAEERVDPQNTTRTSVHSSVQRGRFLLAGGLTLAIATTVYLGVYLLSTGGPVPSLLAFELSLLQGVCLGVAAAGGALYMVNRAALRGLAMRSRDQRILKSG